MLRTLLNEEIRFLAPIHLKMLGIFTVFGLVFLGVTFLDLPVLNVFGMVGAAISFILAIPVVLIHTASEYWQSMYGSRGYLTHAIPVRGRLLYVAKTLYAFVAGLVAGCFTAVGLLVTAWVSATSQGLSVGEVLQPLREMLNLVGTGWVVGFFVYLIVELASVIVCVAAVMSIGAQGRWNHLGFGTPVIGFVVLYLVAQVLSMLLLLTVPVSLELASGNVVNAWMLPDFIEAVRTDSDPTVLGLGFIAVWPLLAVVLWAWGVRAIERHTSLR
ncbi:hypothetical protein SAMN05216355_11638 [Actinomyces ruminicola]|uniref:ABC-2 family transporter protein n=1 Tax=Actinomyces ruminicola TaxID=332524 RepID=A0A1H0EIV7_9ACTO|nr:hypothetical protein [Actinomyces ruminicola]SDN82417.1 hypothetical protein SAMN05216355_11638 [Actinomyces ruminicola]